MPLPLPKGLLIERDLDDEKELLAKARAFLEKGQDKRLGIHASDLMDPRMAAWKKLTGAGIPDRLINMFVVGMVAHAVIEVIFDGSTDYVSHGMDDGTQHYKELQYSPDILEHKGGPNEIKTTRSYYLPKAAYLPDDDTFHMYIEQLMTYMAAEDKTVGRLTALYLNSKGEDGRTVPNFYVWKIQTTPEALVAYRAMLEIKMKQLTKAIEDKNPNSLPLCRAWKCKDCEFFANQCKPEGRYGVEPKLWLK